MCRGNSASFAATATMVFHGSCVKSSERVSGNFSAMFGKLCAVDQGINLLYLEISEFEMPKALATSRKADLALKRYRC